MPPSLAPARIDQTHRTVVRLHTGMKGPVAVRDRGVSDASSGKRSDPDEQHDPDVAPQSVGPTLSHSPLLRGSVTTGSVDGIKARNVRSRSRRPVPAVY